MSGWQKVDADRLRELRLGRMLSQSELATKARTTQAAISSFERGTRSAQHRTVRRLADALGVEPKELVVRRSDGSAEALRIETED